MQSNNHMKTYPKYKDSNIPWIGKIPCEWNVTRNKNFFTCKKEIVGCNSSVTQLLSLTKKGVVKKDINNTDGKQPESFDTYQYVNKDDIVMCLFDLDCSAVFSGISNFNGMISPAYKVLKCKNIVPRFVDYWFSYVSDGRKFNHYAKNIRYTLNFEDFSALPILIPTIREQQSIADFLDRKCSAIDRVIEAESRIIEKLKEYRQSLITETVSHGLNPHAPMKASGIPWIGRIPKHWGIKRLKFVATSLIKGNGITKDEVLPKGDIQCIRYGEIYSKYDGKCTETFSSTNLNLINSPVYVQKGDILFAGTGELIEEIGKNIVYMGYKACLAGGDIVILRHNQDPIFLNYALGSSYAQGQKSFGKSKLKVVHISAEQIGNMIVALPPLSEQKSIADFLDKKCSAIDSTISKKQQIIEKMTEYKKSLIYECVTGKLSI